MKKILLVEPNYRSKFPPLGLMRISSYHKERGDYVDFIRGLSSEKKKFLWDKIYISSLFTYELPRTVKTLKYYSSSIVSNNDLIVGGIGATLLPKYIEKRVKCKIIKGPIDKKNQLFKGSDILSNYYLDYDLIDKNEYQYKPENTYFCRATLGCIRKCNFCAVIKIEPKFKKIQNWSMQIKEADKKFGSRQNLVFLDNNILASKNFKNIINNIIDEGFETGSKMHNRKRIVDFNQGIDIRLITKNKSKELSKISIDPIRLAFDYNQSKPFYKKALFNLLNVGYRNFTNYMLFNYNDTPQDLYNRININFDLIDEYKIRITGFPMRYIPVTDVNRQFISKKWRWRYLRGFQCILLATHGIISPNRSFFNGVFGDTFDEFINILSMPDRYIIYRNKYKDNEAQNWRKLFLKISKNPTIKEELLQILQKLNISNNKKKDMEKTPRRFWRILDHYYPNGKVIRN